MSDIAEKAKTPAIRFKGFTDDWERRKLSDVLVNRRILQRQSEDAPRLAFASGQGVIDLSERKTNNRDQLIADEFSKNYLLTQYNDIVYNPANLKYGAIDRNKLGKGVISPIYVTFTTEEIPSFIERIVTTERFKLKALRFEEGTVVKRQLVSPDKLLSFEEMIAPSKKEQKKIGDFFDYLDHLITLHQRKFEKLQNVKKAMLEKMFPKNGSNVPEIRFAGFTDAWEQRKLGELGNLKNGMNFSKEAMGIGYPFVNLQNIFGKNIIDTVNLGKAEATQKQLNDYNLIDGDILFVRSSLQLEGVGEAALVPKNLENTTYSGFIIRFRDEKGINNNFKRYVFSTQPIRNQIISQATDSANKNINQSVLEELELCLPSDSEQAKIGEYFSNFDNLITLHQRKLEKLKNVKKACLEKMFV